MRRLQNPSGEGVVMAVYGWIGIAVVCGALIALQPAVNAKLARYLSDPIQASLVSFVVGSFALLAMVLASRQPLGFSKLGEVPWRYYTGGLLGALFVTAVTFLIPRIGAATLIAATVAGQFVTALMLDHYGWLGVPEHPLTWPRVLGAALLFLGVYLVKNY